MAVWVHLSFWCKIVNRLLMCEPWLLIFHNMSPLAAVLRSCFSHSDNIQPVPTYSIKGWTGLNRYCYPCNGNICTFWNEMWPVVQFYFSCMSKSKCSFSYDPDTKPSSASASQVGFLWSKASPIQEERFISQGRRRTEMEVPCSGVPLESLAGFWDGCRLWEINSLVWDRKELKRFR